MTATLKMQILFITSLIQAILLSKFQWLQLHIYTNFGLEKYLLFFKQYFFLKKKDKARLTPIETFLISDVGFHWIWAET